MKTINCQYLDSNKGCQNRRCSHHALWDGLDLPDAKETTATLSFDNCMCLIDREFTLEEIAEAWGLTGQRIQQISVGAIMRVGLVAKRRRNVDFFSGDLGFFEDKYAIYQEQEQKKVAWRMGAR